MWQNKKVQIWLLLIVSVTAFTPLLAYFFYLFPNHKFILAGKDFLILIFLLTLLFLNKNSLNRVPLSIAAFAPFVLILSISGLFSDACLSAKIGSFRQLIFPLVFLVMGSLFQLNKSLIEESKKKLKIWTWILIALGLILYFTPAQELHWLKSYFEAKGTDISEADIPAQWLEPIWGGIPRMVSTFFDPVNWGHFLVFALFVFLPQKKKWSDWLLLFLIISSIVLSFCKGAWLQLAVMVGILYVNMPKWVKTLGFFLVPFFILFASSYHDGIANHQAGLENAIKTITLFGYGLGNVGNVAIIFNEQFQPLIYDSLAGAIIGQIGFFGFVTWLVGWFFIVVNIMRTNRILAWLLISQILVSFYSENAFNLLSVMVICLYAGAELALPLIRNYNLAIIDPVGVKAGMDYFSSRLNKSLIKQGFNCRLYSNFTDQNAFACFDDDNQKGKWAKAFNFLKGNAKAIFFTLKRAENDLLLHSFKTTAKETFFMLIAKLLRYRLHLIVHDVEGFDKNDSMLLKKWVFHYLANEIYCLNESSKMVLCEKIKLNESKIYLIKHGHFLDLPNPAIDSKMARDKLNLDKNEFYFLFFGQIKPVKALDLLLKSFAETTHGQLIIAGKVRDDDYSQYRNLISELNLTNRVVEIIRYISNEERELLFKSCNCIVIPYRKIYQSGVLMMAMSYSRPVIASDLPANAEIIQDGVNGYLFESENQLQLTQKMENMKNKTDFDHLTQQAVNILNESYNWTITASVFYKTYQSKT